MIKVLMISVGRMDKGGIESYLMSLLRNTDSRQIHFDYVVHSQDTGCYEKEITERGCRIYKLPRLRSHPFKYLTELMQIMKRGNMILFTAMRQHRSCGRILQLQNWLVLKYESHIHIARPGIMS